MDVTLENKIDVMSENEIDKMSEKTMDVMKRDKTSEKTTKTMMV